MTSETHPPGDAFVGEAYLVNDWQTYNRTHLQAIMKISFSFPSDKVPQVSRHNPTIKAMISAQLTWAADDRPFTVSTNHTPIDGTAPAIATARHFKFRRGEVYCEGRPPLWKRFQYRGPENDVCTDMDFATLPSLSANKPYTIEQEIDVAKILELTPLDHETPIRIALNASWFYQMPAMWWRGWGSFEDELKGKRLIGSAYDQEGIKPFDAGLELRNEEDISYMYLETVFDETEFEIAVVD